MNDVEFALHAAAAEAHDYISARLGSFATITADLAACHSSGVRALVRTTLCRANYRLLDDLASYVARMRVAGWCIDVPTSHATDTAAGARFEQTHPRLALAVPFALRAIDRARGLGVDAWVRGVPLCLLGPMTDRSLPSEPRAYAAACADCAARSKCPGVDAVYLARFGGDELRRRTEAVRICEDHAIGSSFAVAPTITRP